MNSNDNFALEIVYNGEQLTLGKEEAVALAQKGMNYDRLYEKYNSAVNKLDEVSVYKEKVDRLAEQTGTSAEKILEVLENNIADFEVSNYAQEEQVPPEYAKKMMELSREIEALKKEKEELLPIKKREEDIKSFSNEYPDVDIRNLDPEITELWSKSDKPLVDIYNSVMVRKMLQSENARKANEKNQTASCGSVRGSCQTEKQYTDEDIRGMSDAEISRNFKKIMRQLSKREE